MREVLGLPHFADEKTESQVNDQTWGSPTGIKGRLPDANVGGLKLCWFEPPSLNLHHSTLDAQGLSEMGRGRVEGAGKEGRAHLIIAQTGERRGYSVRGEVQEDSEKGLVRVLFLINWNAENKIRQAFLPVSFYTWQSNQERGTRGTVRSCMDGWVVRRGHPRSGLLYHFAESRGWS